MMRLVRGWRDAVLCDAERSISACPTATTSRWRHHLQDRSACFPISARATRQPNCATTRFHGRVLISRWEDQFNLGLDPDTARRLPRRNAAQGRPQGRAFLLDVRPEILLDEDHAGSLRDYAATLNDPASVD